jgi:mRNA interferase RelE/StbE
MWQRFLTEPAKVHLSRFDRNTQDRIIDRLTWFAENFDDMTLAPLTGEWHGYFKLRVGDIRIIYDVDWQNKLVVVRAIGRRYEIYNRTQRLG